MAEKTSEHATDMQQVLDAAVAGNHGFGGGVLRIATHSGLVWEGVSGYADPARKVPMRLDSTFEVASVTKAFTAVVILQQVEEKKLALESRLTALLPKQMTARLCVVGGRDVTAQITVRQLLSHTSGLANYWYDPPFVKDKSNAFLTAFMASPGQFWRPSVILSYVPGLTPAGRPGAGFHYADTNYVLLGLIAAGLDHKPLHEVYRARLLEPLGMHHTYLSYREPPRTTTPEAHRFEREVDLFGKIRQSADWAGGGLVSNTLDLERFLFALAKGKLFRSARSLVEMQTWIPTEQKDVSYGLGLYAVQLNDGHGLLWGHDGHGNSFMYYWPEKGMAFTGTLNQTTNDWWSMVTPILKGLSRP